MTARFATTRAAGEFCWVDLKTRDVPATTALRLTDPQGLRLTVVRA